MGWVTLEDGQHVFIGAGGNVLPRGPSARADRIGRLKTTMPAGKVATVRARAAALIRAKRAKDAASKPRAIDHAKTEAASIGHKPGEKFSLIQRSATGTAPLKNAGGSTKFMFDMKAGDKPGQTSMFDRPGFAGKTDPAAEEKLTSVKARELTAEARSKTAEKLVSLKKVADVQAHPEVHAKAGDVVQIGVKHVAFDPERFQYKLNATGAHGVSTELHQVKNWNPESAGVISVWRDPQNGQTFVVNGHHRLDLANRLGVEKVTARYIDAPDAATARMKGAITNIAEGRGTAVDAAKFFREAGIDKAKIHEHGIPMTEATAKHGMNMAGLEAGLFKKVVNQEIPMERASIIGGSGLSHAQQIEVHNMSVKSRANNETLKELVENAKAAPTIRTTSRSLFGDSEEEKSLALNRARVQANVSRSLAGDKKLFGLVSKSKAAESLEERGRSHIDTEETGKVSAEAAQVMGVFHTLKNRSGPVASELNQAAERLHAGESEASVMKEARGKITEHVRNILSGGAAAFAA
jgi:hypothetical protein